MKKLSKVIAATVVCTLWGSITAFAGEWKSDANGWWYAKDDGSYVASDWLSDNGKMYYFNADGYMVSDAWVGNYYVGNDGAMLTSTTTPDGYYVGADGAWVEGGIEQIQNETLQSDKNLPNGHQIKEIADTYGNNQELYNLRIHTMSLHSGMQIYDRGDYYEITNLEITINDSPLDINFVESKSVGNYITIHGEERKIESIEKFDAYDEEGNFIQCQTVNVYDQNEKYRDSALYLSKTKYGYMAVEYHDYCQTPIYNGNLYFSKNCKMITGWNHMNFLTLDDYLFTENNYNFLTCQGGKRGYYEGVVFDGNFKVDENGIIIEYTEIARS